MRDLVRGLRSGLASAIICLSSPLRIAFSDYKLLRQISRIFLRGGIAPQWVGRFPEAIWTWKYPASRGFG